MFQNEVLNRQIQKEIWRIQDVMEGLRKNNPSRGTDTAKHRGGRLPPALGLLASPETLHCLRPLFHTCQLTLLQALYSVLRAS